MLPLPYTERCVEEGPSSICGPISDGCCCHGAPRRLEAYIFAAAAAAAAADDGFSPVSFDPGFVVLSLLAVGGDVLGNPDTGDRLRPPRRLVVVGRNGGGEPLAAFILIPPIILLPWLILFGETERVEPGRASESISTGILL